MVKTQYEKICDRSLLVAVLACPCHVLALLVLLEGTAIGALLGRHSLWLVLGSAAVMVMALLVWSAFWPKRHAEWAACATDGCRTSGNRHAA